MVGSRLGLKTPSQLFDALGCPFDRYSSIDRYTCGPPLVKGSPCDPEELAQFGARELQRLLNLIEFVSHGRVKSSGRPCAVGIWITFVAT